MTGHPIAAWDAKARKRADRIDKRPHLWWEEYRAAYAEAAGLLDEPPAIPDAALSEYLAGLDDRILEERAKFTAPLREAQA